jgi:hypothetical protein
MVRLCFLVVPVLVLSLVSTSCADEPKGLIARLSLEGGRTAFRPGEPITMTLTITNYTGHPVQITYPDDRRFDFSIFNKAPQALDYVIGVWAWSSENEYPEYSSKEEYWATEESITFEGTWLQNNWEGKQVEPGVYSAEGRNTACHTGVNFHCDTTAGFRFEIR